MRHKKKGRKFGRERNQRRALMRGLAASFFVAGKIRTTEAKAKSLRPFAEKLITRAKKPSLPNQRYLYSILPPRAGKMALEIAKSFSQRSGGYTRIVKLGARKSDGAKMAILEFVK